MPANQQFNTTRWSLLWQLRQGTETESTEALEILCQGYWLPLYAWLRGSGRSAEDAEDVIQEFFIQLIQRQVLQKANPEKGRLRSFLLHCLKNYLADRHEYEGAAKRAGRAEEISLDFIQAEQGIDRELQSPDADPAAIYEARWARAILQRSLARVRQKYEKEGKVAVFMHLNRFLSEDLERGRSYAEAAQALQMSEGAVRISFHKLKKRFQQAFREEVARTLSPEDDLGDEMRYLVEVLS